MNNAANGNEYDKHYILVKRDDGVIVEQFEANSLRMAKKMEIIVKYKFKDDYKNCHIFVVDEAFNPLTRSS